MASETPEKAESKAAEEAAEGAAAGRNAVGESLQRFGMKQHADAIFGYGGDCIENIKLLREADLERLGIPPLNRRRFLMKVQKLYLVIVRVSVSVSDTKKVDTTVAVL